ncbi:MAG: porin [Acidobacteria bacterium]|nr:porin [Acidobacteriota bacterium]
MKPHRLTTCGLVFLLLVAAPRAILAQEAGGDGTAAAVEQASEGAPEQQIGGEDNDGPPLVTVQGVTGLAVESADGRFRMQLWLRGQFRASYPFAVDPHTASDFERDPINDFRINRARLKMGGNVYEPWINYYFVNGRLLDLRFTFSRFEWLQFRVGQWKVNYNRERVDSSGKQQFVERSIVNREFTIDRQDGVMVGGRVAPGRVYDFRYYVGAFTGNGAGEGNDDNVPMVLGRLTWNMFGRDLRFSQSDVGRYEEVAATLSVATISNQSPYTRFSSAGGGQLDGIVPIPDSPHDEADAPGAPGQYRVRQYLQEFALMHRGLSLQQEYHWKRVEDRVNGTTRRLRGLYVQAGYFLHELIASIPAPLEVAVRYAWVDPNTEVDADDRRELTFGANWFFAGHDNKLTADISRLTMEQAGADTLADTRFRLQWDVSF